MLLRSLRIPKSEFEAGTGWTLKPEAHAAATSASHCRDGPVTSST